MRTELLTLGIHSHCTHKHADFLYIQIFKQFTVLFAILVIQQIPSIPPAQLSFRSSPSDHLFIAPLLNILRGTGLTQLKPWSSSTLTRSVSPLPLGRSCSSMTLPSIALRSWLFGVAEQGYSGLASLRR